ATRSHFLTLDCMGLLSEIVLVDDEGAPERAPERPSSLYACIPLVAAIFPISPFAGPDGGKAFDRFNLHYIFGHFIAQLPLDPQPQRSPMRHRQRRVVHFVGEQSLRVESVPQPDALVILGCIEGLAQRIRAIEHQVAGLWFKTRALQQPRQRHPFPLADATPPLNTVVAGDPRPPWQTPQLVTRPTRRACD